MKRRAGDLAQYINIYKVGWEFNSVGRVLVFSMHWILFPVPY